MRKVLALTAMGALAIGLVGYAATAGAGEETQTEYFKISPLKLPKKKHSNVRYLNTLTTFNDPALDQPPSAYRTVVNYSKNFKFNYQDWPKCKVPPEQLAQAGSTAEAKQMCGRKSLVSEDAGSNATVIVGNVPPPFDVIDVDVAAFNSANKTLLLFSKPTGEASTVAASILPGRLKKSKEKGYGQALDVKVPKLAAGGISEFNVTIPKSKYVQLRCKPRTVKILVTTYFDDGTPTTSDDYQQPCTPKKGK